MGSPPAKGFGAQAILIKVVGRPITDSRSKTIGNAGKKVGYKPTTYNV